MLKSGNNKKYTFSLIILTFVAVIFSISSDKSEDLYKHFLDSVNQNSSYKLMLKRGSMVIEDGMVGDFYNCMTRYRSGHKWKKTSEGKLSNKHLLVDDRYLLRMSIFGSEVVKLTLLPLNGSGNVSVVAVNCDLTLLTKA
tara:strand:+ start:2456 stop:2875 length:420 start_codon:yes stop_codon:yes gene_type:complete